MTYDFLKHLKSSNQTIKLLNSDNFALTLSFFYLVFVKERHITLYHSEILQYLDDYLYEINSMHNNIFVKTAKEYLDDFANHGYLKKYHGDGDEALYELTPYTNKALEFLESLQKNSFVASRSKFNIIFDLLEDLEFETNMDDNQRIKKLESQKKEIDFKIEAIRAKKDLRYDSARIKEHYIQIDEIARKLKYDFSEIEYNFRALNRVAMEQITVQDDTKSEVLGSIFAKEDEIRDSDQGKSFFAFWQLLSDTKRADKFTYLLENLYKIETIAEIDRDEKLKDMNYSLLKSGEKIYRVSAKLIEQLRRFIDDRVWIENRRVLQLCKSIEKSALQIKHNQPQKRNFFEIKGDRVKIDSIFEKSLYSIKKPQEFQTLIKKSVIDIDMDSFYNIFFVDEDELKGNISKLLHVKTQCSLAEIVDKFPVKKGVSELITYISIAKNTQYTIIDENALTQIEILDIDNRKKIVNLPKIVFTKGSK